MKILLLVAALLIPSFSSAATVPSQDLPPLNTDQVAQLQSTLTDTLDQLQEKTPAQQFKLLEAFGKQFTDVIKNAEHQPTDIDRTLSFMLTQLKEKGVDGAAVTLIRSKLEAENKKINAARLAESFSLQKALQTQAQIQVRFNQLNTARIAGQQELMVAKMSFFGRDKTVANAVAKLRAIQDQLEALKVEALSSKAALTGIEAKERAKTLQGYQDPDMLIQAINATMDAVRDTSASVSRLTKGS